MSERICSIKDCIKPIFGRNWCAMHHARWLRHGDPQTILNRRGTPPFDRWMDDIDASGDCWEWVGAKDSNGYGMLHVAGRTERAHRWGYEYLVGPVPEGLELDHLCKDKGCVNPDHLEPVTHQENMRRALARHSTRLRLLGAALVA